MSRVGKKMTSRVEKVWGKWRKNKCMIGGHVPQAPVPVFKTGI